MQSTKLALRQLFSTQETFLIALTRNKLPDNADFRSNAALEHCILNTDISAFLKLF